MNKRILIAGLIIAALAFVAFNNIREKETVNEYLVITAFGKSNFEEKVNEKLKEGYTLAGGVSYGDGAYMQAVYK